ncbi:MAG TPA: hypothetical protein VEF06_08750 [Bryobacteraceae bacterium]|nr:hypothetical protein [Bryobacteraceae bacterium]
MFLIAALSATFAATLAAASFRLYMKDGETHLVREYRVEGDTVRFYSIDRSEWEEVPAELVDLNKTEADNNARQATIAKQVQEQADEDAAAKAAKAEIRKIPTDPGLYRLENDQLRIFKEIDSVVHNEKAKNTLKRLSPLPVFDGKATLEIPGERSENVITGEDRPEFFLQVYSFEPFAIVKATPQKGVRVLEKISVEPITKMISEERSTVEIFQKELSDTGLFRIWPQEPLPKGEYAVVEYTEGKMNQRVWDFRIE